MDQTILSIPEVARRTRVSNETVRQWIYAGTLRAFRLPGGPKKGGPFRVRLEDVEAIERDYIAEEVG